MSAKSDQVFQVSLTELAFMIAFILLFLLGFQVIKIALENRELSESLSEMEGIEQKRIDLENAASTLSEAIAAASTANPDEVISRLMADSGAKAEVERLKRQLEEQDEQITALAEIQKAVEQVPAEQKAEKIKEEIQQSLLLASEVRRQAEALANSAESQGGEGSEGSEGSEDRSKDPAAATKQAVAALKEMAEIRKLLKTSQGTAERSGESTADQVADLLRKARAHAELAANGKSPEAVKRENADLRGQISFLQNKLNAKGGMDYPPCWADEQTGKIQMLLYVELRDNDLSVAPAWPPSREADAMRLPNIQAVLANPVTTYPQFIRDTQAISDLSRTLNCRHYVKLKSTIADAVQSDRRRLMVEDSFYKLEVRR